MTGWHHLLRGKKFVSSRFEKKIKKDVGEIEGDVYIKQLKDIFVPKRADLYMISGFFTEVIDEKVNIATSGYFFGEEGKNFKGEMIDIYGPSEIKGGLHEDALIFEKRYTMKKDGSPIIYDLRNTHKNYFKGKYYFEKEASAKGCAELFLKKTDIKEKVVIGPPKPRKITEDFYRLA